MDVIGCTCSKLPLTLKQFRTLAFVQPTKILRLTFRLYLKTTTWETKRHHQTPKDTIKHNLSGHTSSGDVCWCRLVSVSISQRQTSTGMTKPILYHKTHTAWQKTYCMSFTMPSYFPCIHGKTHVISAPPYPWLFPCSNLSSVSQLFAFVGTF